MFAPFYTLAARSPSRQAAFRQLVAAHLAVLTAAVPVLLRQGPTQGPMLLSQMLLTAGIVEGALLVGWRLTQLPRSQALEFLLVSPLRPRRLFVAEAAVGLSLLALVTLSGLPVLALLAASGGIDPLDLAALTLTPFVWGAVTGLGLTAWAYEPKRLRRAGEVVLMGLILVYLLVGVLAGEKLREWLSVLPDDARTAGVAGFQMLHTHNPFGALRWWMENDVAVGWRRLAWLNAGGMAAVGVLLWRAAARLQGHFRERHYEPVRDVRGERRPPVGDRPLAWWAVKRVGEYSGRINLWLAGGFCLAYALSVVAGDQWPAWMGRRIFRLCDEAGGVAALAAALVLLAAVPAAFQYGLWDSSVQDRCRRLELLLLTDLRPRDYWDAAAAAAWARGRGYFAVAVLLWAAGLLGGRLTAAQAATAVAAAVLLWALYFALGFRAFTRGRQANGLGLALTIGLPLAALGLGRLGLPLLGDWLPPGMVYRAGAGPAPLPWLLGPLAVTALTLAVARTALADCDARLRRWYDEHHGNKYV